MKKCPFCAEVIKREAIVCRYCGRDLPAAPVPAPLMQQMTAQSFAREKGIPIEQVIAGIKAGTYKGGQAGDYWYVEDVRSHIRNTWDSGGAAKTERTTTVKEKLRNFLLILVAGALSFVVYTTCLIGLTLLKNHYQAQGSLEGALLISAYIKPVGILWVGLWVLLSGLFLKRERAKKWGRRMLYIYFGVPLIAYLGSVLF